MRERNKEDMMKNLHLCHCCGYLCVEYHNYHGYEIIDDVLLCPFCSAAYHEKVYPLYQDVKDTITRRRLENEAVGC